MNREINDKLDQILRNYLQRQISLYIKGKLFRTGRFMLYRFSDFFIELDVDIKDKIRKIILPLPFGVEHHDSDSLVYFDYRLNTFYSNLINKTKPQTSKNRFFCYYIGDTI